MKILDILVKESFDVGAGVAVSTSRPTIAVSDLNSLQLRTLNRLKDGVVDIDSASDKELDVIMDLIDIGLVDTDGNVTDAGLEAGETPDTNVKLTAPSGQDDEDTIDAGDDFSDDIDDVGDDIDFSIDRTSRQDY